MRIAIALLVWASASVASADALPLITCAPGWRATNAGHHVYCAPISCTSDAQCGGGTCSEVARCMHTLPVDVGFGPPTDPPITFEEPTTTLCAADGSCSADTHCAHARECSPPPATTFGCAVAHGHTSASWLVLGLALVVLTRARAVAR